MTFQSNWRIPLLLAIALVLSCFLEALGEAPQAAASPASQAHWPSPYPQGNDLLVVTITRPGIRQKCRVKSIEPDAIACANGSHGTRKIFPRSEVAALLVPGYHPRMWIFNLVRAAFEGGSIYGAVVLAGTGIGATVGGVVMAVVVTLAIMGSFEPDTGESSDTLLYLEPGQQLTVSLR